MDPRELGGEEGQKLFCWVPQSWPVLGGGPSLFSSGWEGLGGTQEGDRRAPGMGYGLPGLHVVRKDPVIL